MNSSYTNSQRTNVMMNSFRAKSDLHVARKIWHISTGLIGLFAFYHFDLSTRFTALMLLGLSLAAFIVETLRLKHQVLNDLIMKVMAPFMRESERKSISGFPFYALGVSLSLFLYDERIAILAILFLVFADPISSYFGVLYGKDKIIGAKSVQGALAGFTTCALLTVVYGLFYSHFSLNLLAFAFFCGVIGSLSELLSTFIDDNLVIPIVSGLGISLINNFFIVL